MRFGALRRDLDLITASTPTDRRIAVGRHRHPDAVNASGPPSLGFAALAPWPPADPRSRLERVNRCGPWLTIGCTTAVLRYAVDVNGKSLRRPHRGTASDPPIDEPLCRLSEELKPSVRQAHPAAVGVAALSSTANRPEPKSASGRSLAAPIRMQQRRVI